MPRSIKLKVAGAALLAVCCAFAGANALVVSARLHSVVRYSRLMQTTGAEAAGLYGIYKVWRGHALYVSLREQPTTFLFNYLFYQGYGRLARRLVSDPNHLPLFAHLTTFAAASLLGLGMLAFFAHRLRSLSKDIDPALRAAVLVLPFLSISGPFMGWWYVAARPDLIGAGFEVAALVALLSNLDRGISWPRLVCSTLLFWIAWSFKQTFVLAFVGTLCGWVLTRQWKHLAWSLSVFGVLCAVPFFVYGHPYVEHTLEAPAVSPWLSGQFEFVLLDTLKTGFYIVVPTLLAVPFEAKAFWQTRRLSATGMLALVFVMSLVGGAVAAGKDGSSRNYYLTSYLAATLYLGLWWLRCLELADPSLLNGTVAVALLSTTLGGGLSASYVVFPNRFGRIALTTPEGFEQRQSVQRTIAASRKPAFVGDAFLALPWLADQYPSDVIDGTFYARGEAAGLVVPIADRARTREYAEGFVDEDMKQAFEDAGYREGKPVGTLHHFFR
jgi:hypothetical protein